VSKLYNQQKVASEVITRLNQIELRLIETEKKEKAEEEARIANTAKEETMKKISKPKIDSAWEFDEGLGLGLGLGLTRNSGVGEEDPWFGSTRRGDRALGEDVVRADWGSGTGGDSSWDLLDSLVSPPPPSRTYSSLTTGTRGQRKDLHKDRGEDSHGVGVRVRVRVRVRVGVTRWGGYLTLCTGILS